MRLDRFSTRSQKRGEEKKSTEPCRLVSLFSQICTNSETLKDKKIGAKKRDEVPSLLGRRIS